MECIYLPEFNKNFEIQKVNSEQSRHLRALHLNDGDKIMVSNGSGLLSECLVIREDRNDYRIKSLRIEENPGELYVDIHLAMGLIKSKDRFEFAMEKAIELGIKKFIPLITRYTEKQNVNLARLESKAVAAMKQSRRSVLTSITSPKYLNELLNHNYKNIFLADENGIKLKDFPVKGKTLILVGPEGGFAKEEKELIRQNVNTTMIKLGNHRLRSETASVTAVTLVSNLIG